MTQIDSDWKESLVAFFSERAKKGGVQSFEEMCFVSGRDPRLWTEALYNDLICDIANNLKCHPGSRVLEVGCASGFLASGVSKKVGNYVGVDLALPPLNAAKSLGLLNASFKQCDGGDLPFADDQFDCSYCYDVLTNFPTFDDAVPLIQEMLRVTKPGGMVLVGSIPDQAFESENIAAAQKVSLALDAEHGSRVLPSPNQSRPSWLRTLLNRIEGKSVSKVTPKIVCYYFSREQFSTLARELKVSVELVDIHSLNPYRGYRFNAIFAKAHDENRRFREG